MKTREEKIESALREIIAISDRKHDAWDRAKAAIALPAPAPKVDMGPCGLSEEEKGALASSDSLLQHGSDDATDYHSAVRVLAATIRRLLSSTPPDPSSAAKEAVIKSVLKADKLRHSHMTTMEALVEAGVWSAAARLAALGQEKP